MSKPKVKIDCLFGVLAFVLPLFLYASTLCPTVPVGDGGELTCAAYSLGIAHPTGYPLFCLWGRIFVVALPLGSVAVRINLLSAFFASLAVLLVYFIAREMFWKIFKAHRLFVYPVSLTTSLIFGFSKTLWSQAVQSEVYTLHIFLVAALILVMVLWHRTGQGRLAYLWAFLWGLSFSNHTSVIFLSAVILYLAIAERGRLGRKKHLPGMALFFLLGLSLYLYLPLRSVLDPPHDWGNPESLRPLWDHVTARLYRQHFLFAFPMDVLNNLRHYVRLLADQFGVSLLILGFLGAVLQGRWWRRLFLLLLLAGLSNVLLAACYDIEDIEAYFLPSYLIFCLWLGLALSVGLSRLLSRREGVGLRVIIAAAILIGLAMVPLATNFSRASQRGRTIARDYGMNILSSVEPDAILFTAADNESFPTLYLHYVEGVRSDISLFDVGSTVEGMSHFLGQNWSLSEETPARLRRMIVGRTRRPVNFTKEHMSPRTDILQADDLLLEPVGLIYRLQKDPDQMLDAQLPWSEYLREEFEDPGQFPDYRIRRMVANYYLSWGEDLLARKDTTAALRKFSAAQATLEDEKIAIIHNEMGIFFRRIGWAEGAKLEFQRALSSPQKTRKDESSIHGNLGNLFAQQGRTDQAQREWDRALSIWPGNREAQFNFARFKANEYLGRSLFAEAAAEFEKMLALDQNNPAISYNLGLIYARRLQQPARALEHFRRCLAMDPQGPVAAAAKVEIERLRKKVGRQ